VTGGENPGMTAFPVGRSARRPAAPGPCLTSRPSADAVIAALFALAVLAFLLGLLALSV
jgi:hypothetical protein